MRSHMVAHLLFSIDPVTFAKRLCRDVGQCFDGEGVH